MKIPLRWLRDYVALDLSVAQLCERLTLAGLEVASVRSFGLPAPEGVRIKPEDQGPLWLRDRIVIAQILEVKKHPDADKLKLPMVEYGAGEPKQLVTGAPNLSVGDSGQKVILALAGSALYDGHSKEKAIKELKPTKIRGIPSDAMCCSYYELGVTDDHEGIVILDDDAPVGTPLADFMGDLVIEVDVLPNMARCLSMIGIAREVAAITGTTLKYPPHQVQAGSESIAGKIQVAIEDPKLSARYTATLLRNVKLGPAPGWMQRRLIYTGMRPINNIVDITNYVMLEWGQPLHAFDHDVLVKRAGGKAPRITVRPARAGEKLVTLDKVERTLAPENLVIADDVGPIALAGVMGGLETEVTEKTTSILLESASFDFVSIRRTMRAFNLISEASTRFSKGIHPELVKPAAERAAEMMRLHAGATVCAGIVDCYPAPLPPQVVTLKMSEVQRLLGVDLPSAEAQHILRALEFQVEQVDGQTLKATAPPHRLDIQEGAADLIEDLARIYGYDRLPATLMADRLPAQHNNQPIQFEERLRDLLVAAGLQEAVTYALTRPECEAPLGVAGEYVKLLNPLSSERVVMRKCLLASVLERVATNLIHADDVRLFEVGFVYLPKSPHPNPPPPGGREKKGQPLSHEGRGEKLPDEPRRLALAMTGKRRGEFWTDSSSGEPPPQSLDFFDLKGVVEALANDLHLTDVTFAPSRAPYLHPGQAAELRVGGKTVGHFGALHPRLTPLYDRMGRTLLVGEFDLEELQPAVPERHRSLPVPQFPAALRDIAVVVPEEVTHERLVQEIEGAGGELLRGVRLFDVYRGSSIPSGSKSLAFALTYRAGDRTLTDGEVNKTHKKIEDRLKSVLKAQVRGEKE